jgi:hypothetical protein
MTRREQLHGLLHGLIGKIPHGEFVLLVPRAFHNEQWQLGIATSHLVLMEGEGMEVRR